MANVVKYILDVNTKKAVDGLDDVSKEAKEAGQQLDKTKRSGLDMAAKIGSAVTGVAAGIGLAVGAFQTLAGAIQGAANASFEFSRAVVDSVNQLNDLNARSGLTASSIQAVILAFEASGQSAQKAEGAISRFPQVLNLITTEGTAANDTIQRLGVQIQDSSGKLRSADQIFQDTIQALQNIDDDTTRTTTAFEIFGRAAADLLQAFGKTANFDKFLAITEEFGVKTGPEASFQAGIFQQQLAVLDIVVGGLRQTFVEALGGVNLFNKGLTNTIKFVVTLQEFIKGSEEQFQVFSSSIVNIGSIIFDFFRSTLNSLNQFTTEAVTFILTKLAMPIYALNAIGVVSDETFAKVEALITESRSAANAVENIVEAATSDGFGGGSSAGQRAEELLNSLFAGLDTAAGGASVEIDNLSTSMDNLKEKSQDLEILFGGENQYQFDELNNAIKTIEQATTAFNPLQAAANKARNQVLALEDAFNTYTQLGLDTLEVEELLIKAYLEEDKAKKKLLESTQKAKVDFEGLGNTIAGFISNISDPSSFVQSLGGAASKAGQFLPKVGSAVGGQVGAGLTAAGAGLVAAGPIIGAVGAVVVALEKLGQSTPKELEERFDSFVENFEKGARLLPKLIADIGPEFIGKLLSAVIEAFISLSFQLPRAIFDAQIKFTTTFISELTKALFGWLERIKDFFNNFGEYFSNIFTREGRKENRQRILGFESGGRYIPSAESGLRFTGASEGLAMLHRGEYVVPESNRRSQAVDRTMNGIAGGGVQIVVNADIVEQGAIDELVRRIEQRFQGFGGGRSTLFGGV